MRGGPALDRADVAAHGNALAGSDSDCDSRFRADRPFRNDGLVGALYRHFGIPVEKLWENPPAATSLADFWGNRWNRIFSGFGRDLLFLPLARVVGVRVASFAVFVFSSLIHEWAWSMSVRGGYGGPALYFLLQGLLVQVESNALGRRLDPAKSARRSYLDVVGGPRPLAAPGIASGVSEGLRGAVLEPGLGVRGL